MAVGAANALERLDKLDQVKIVSQNGAPYGLDLIKAGKLQLTNANPPSIASVMALRLLIGVIKGEIEPDHFYWVSAQLIDKKSGCCLSLGCRRKRHLSLALLTSARNGDSTSCIVECLPSGRELAYTRYSF